MKGLVAKVALNGATFAFDKLYTYAIPPELHTKVKSGMRVLVPFGKANIKKQGMVFEVLEDELKAVSDRLIITTDDGSNGVKGFVTDRLKELIESGEKYDAVIAIGPIVMMRAVANLTKEYGIKTIVSMNPVMIDGTGMCGGCRVTVGGETKFACVDGPDFDGHLIDWQAALNRQKMFKAEENRSCSEGKCRIGRSN